MARLPKQKTEAVRPRLRAPPKPPGLIRAPPLWIVERVEEVLDECFVDEIAHVDMPLIASHYGIYGRKRALHGAEGQLLTSGNVGLVSVDPAAVAVGSFNFVLGHELGHAVFHPGYDAFGRCLVTRWRGGIRKRENEANDFSAEGNVPRRLLLPWLGAIGEPAGSRLEHVREVAHLFSVPVESAALRVLLFAEVACAVVYSAGGRVRWWARNAGFSTIVPWGGRVDERTSAARLHGGGSRIEGPRSLAAASWDRSERSLEIREEAVLLAGSDRVLTWLVEPA